MVIHWTRKQQGTVFHHSSIHCWLWWRKLLIGFQHFKTRFWNQQDLLRCEHKSINLTQFTWLNATQTHAPWHSVLVFVHSFLVNTGGLWVFIFFSTLRCIELWSHYEVSNKFYFIYVNIHQQAKCQKIFSSAYEFHPNLIFRISRNLRTFIIRLNWAVPLSWMPLNISANSTKPTLHCVKRLR